MECPPGCPEIVYQIMRSCWKWDPGERPNFWEIHGTLVSLLQPLQYLHEEDLFDNNEISPPDDESKSGLHRLFIYIYK